MKNLILILSLTALAGCSGPPSVEEIKEQLVSVVVGDAGGIATVENFEKINGYEKGEEKYIADVTYDLVFSKDAKGMLQQAIKKSPPATFAAMGSEGLALAAFGPAMMDLVAGQKFSIRDTVTLIKSVRAEKGWVLEEWHPEAIGEAMGESLLEKWQPRFHPETPLREEGRKKILSSWPLGMDQKTRTGMWTHNEKSPKPPRRPKKRKCNA